jgi:HSP20 family molecular chaperone IbpA
VDRDLIVKFYLKLSTAEKDEVSLNVIKGKVELKVKTFNKMIYVLVNIDVEKVSLQYKKSILTIIISKKSP